MRPEPMNEEKELNDDFPIERTGAATNSEAESISRGEGEKQQEERSQAMQLPPDLASAYQKVLAERQDLYDRLLRKQAEFENFRKRVHREKEEFLQHANIDFIRTLLPVLDGFERALRHREAGVQKSFYDGIELIHQELLGVLSRAGVTPIDAEGKLFDPHLHQAVETVEAKGHRDQEIVEELQRGYKLKNRLLRPAIVKVAAAPKK